MEWGYRLNVASGYAEGFPVILLVESEDTFRDSCEDYHRVVP